MEPIISVRNLVKTYLMGEIEVQALRGVSFDIDRASLWRSWARRGRANPR